MGNVATDSPKGWGGGGGKTCVQIRVFEENLCLLKFLLVNTISSETIVENLLTILTPQKNVTFDRTQSKKTTEGIVLCQGRVRGGGGGLQKISSAVVHRLQSRSTWRTMSIIKTCYCLFLMKDIRVMSYRSGRGCLLLEGTVSTPSFFVTFLFLTDLHVTCFS